MAYKYLKDGTDYNAKELNDRFDSEQANINSTTSEEMKHGALSEFHLPMMIGVGNKAEGEIPVFTDESVSDFDDVSFHPSGSEVARVLFSPALNMKEDSVSAVILMFDCNIEEFQEFRSRQGEPETWGPFTSYLRREDLYYATFRFEVNGVLLEKSARSVSPGWTLSGSTEWMYNDVRNEENRGINLPYDIYSFQTVSMRTVLLPEDLGDFDEIFNVKVIVNIGTYVGATMSGGVATPPEPTAKNVRITVSKHNFTCLPIRAKVT